MRQLSGGLTLAFAAMFLLPSESFKDKHFYGWSCGCQTIDKGKVELGCYFSLFPFQLDQLEDRYVTNLVRK